MKKIIAETYIVGLSIEKIMEEIEKFKNTGWEFPDGLSGDIELYARHGIYKIRVIKYKCLHKFKVGQRVRIKNGDIKEFLVWLSRGAFPRIKDTFIITALNNTCTNSVMYDLIAEHSYFECCVPEDGLGLVEEEKIEFKVGDKVLVECVIEDEEDEEGDCRISIYEDLGNGWVNKSKLKKI